MRSALTKALKFDSKEIAVAKVIRFIQKAGGFKHAAIFVPKGNFFALDIYDYKVVLYKLRTVLTKMGLIINSGPQEYVDMGILKIDPGILKFPNCKGEKEEQEMFERIIDEIDSADAYAGAVCRMTVIMPNQATATDATAAGPAPMLTAFNLDNAKTNTNSTTEIPYVHFIAPEFDNNTFSFSGPGSVTMRAGFTPNR